MNDSVRLQFLIDSQMSVRRLTDTGLWMLLAQEYPATGNEYETPREAIDATIFSFTDIGTK